MHGERDAPAPNDFGRGHLFHKKVLFNERTHNAGDVGGTQTQAVRQLDTGDGGFALDQLQDSQFRLSPARDAFFVIPGARHIVTIISEGIALRDGKYKPVGIQLTGAGKGAYNFVYANCATRSSAQESFRRMIRDPEKPIRTRPLPDEYPGVHSMDEDEVEAAVRVVRSKSLYRYYGVNPQHEVAAFEAEFARFIGVRHAVAVTSGTSALHTALCALQVGPGDEVIIPAYMWVSVVAAVVNLGAIPVLAEIDETFGLDPADVERKITSRTAGIIAVHMNGCAVNIPRLVAIARRHSVFLLEDCAQCVGATVAGRRAGTFGDVAIFSFQLNKNMTVGEAGAVVTNDELLYRRVVAIQDSGYSRSDTDELQMDDTASYSWGRGVRMDELRAAVLRVQLRKVETTIERMRHSKNRILESLYPRQQIAFRRRIDPAGDTSCFLLTIFPHRDTAREINRLMRLHGITTKSPDTSNILLANYGMHIYYNIPSLVQKVGTGKHGFPWTLAENQHSVYSYERGACPASDDLFERTQLLVIPSCLTARDEEDIIESFHRAMDAVLGPVTSMTSRLDQREYLTSPCG